MERGMEGQSTGASLYAFIIKQTWPLTRNKCRTRQCEQMEKAQREREKRGRPRMNVMKKRDGNGGGRGDGVPVCRAERCAVHHLQTGRQGCLGSLFLPQYKRSLERLQQSGSTFQWGVLGQLLSWCDIFHACRYSSKHMCTQTHMVSPSSKSKLMLSCSQLCVSALKSLVFCVNVQLEGLFS